MGILKKLRTFITNRNVKPLVMNSRLDKLKGVTICVSG